MYNSTYYEKRKNWIFCPTVSDIHLVEYLKASKCIVFLYELPISIPNITSSKPIKSPDYQNTKLSCFSYRTPEGQGQGPGLWFPW